MSGDKKEFDANVLVQNHAEEIVVDILSLENLNGASKEERDAKTIYWHVPVQPQNEPIQKKRTRSIVLAPASTMLLPAFFMRSIQCCVDILLVCSLVVVLLLVMKQHQTEEVRATGGGSSNE